MTFRRAGSPGSDGYSMVFVDVLLCALGMVLLLMAAQALLISKPATGDLRSFPVDLVFVVDATASQGPVLEKLKGAMISAAEILARLCRVRIGVVAYRAGVAVLPLTLIEAGPDSQGLRALREFGEARTLQVELQTMLAPERGRGNGTRVWVGNLYPLTGYADVEAGLRAGFELLNGTDPEPRSVLIWLGDVGPFEGGDPKRIDEADRQSGERVRALVQQFATQSRAKFMALYTGSDGPPAWHAEASKAFFQDMASAAGKGGRYSDDVSQLFATIVAAALTENDE